MVNITSIYRQLFGKRDPVEGNVIDMAEHGRTGGISSGTAYKNVFPMSPMVTKLDYDGGANPIYIGVANPGSATSSAVWQIKKLTWDGNNNPTSILAANGTTEYNQIWDNRVSLTYS